MNPFATVQLLPAGISLHVSDVIFTWSISTREFKRHKTFRIKYDRERLLMAKKRILSHFKIESNTI